MSRNPVSAAIELVDIAPSNEFRTSLRAQLLADFSEPATPGTPATQSPNETAPKSDEYITLEPSPSRFGPSPRLYKTVLVAAACLAVFATGAVIANRSGTPNATTELNDVDRQEALPLARHALITTDALGIQWTSGYSWDESELPTQATATIAALPECALLKSVGLVQPTTKSATAHQFVPGDTNFLFQQVFVFATTEDASRAMDVIDGDVFPTCWFNLFDRLTPLEPAGWTSTTEAWHVTQLASPLDPVQIAPHGDRQIIIGQHTTINRSSGPLERYFVNAFVQVGRTISWVNPRLLTSTELFDSSPSLRAVGVNEAITAATNALKKAIGP
jgi:hypothetical protein